MRKSLENKATTFISLGCKLNFAENSSVCDRLEKLGAHRTLPGETADICIINTCTVTETANHKSRQAIHKVIRENPHAFVVVMGCYAQTHFKTLSEIEGVDLVVGMEQKGQVVELIEEMLAQHESASQNRIFHTERKEIVSFVPSCSRGTRTRYFLKIQDGCDYFCTYCAIPFARGKSRNGSIASLVEQAQQVVMQGGKEIVITGVNIGDFGKTTGERFVDLVKALDQVEGISRYRISSMEPDLLSDELIDYCAKSRAFMPHWHIPLQSGSDTVLKLMHRHYDRQLFADKIHRIKEVTPDAFIGVDVMVGCRGETPECFEETYEFLKALDVTQLHVFPYSERPGTSALSIPYVVSDTDKRLRSQRLLELSEQKTQAFYERYIGTEAEVLFEKAPRGKAMHGFTPNYVRVELPASAAREEYDNQLMHVRLGDFNHDRTALKVEQLLNGADHCKR